MVDLRGKGICQEKVVEDRDYNSPVAKVLSWQVDAIGATHHNSHIVSSPAIRLGCLDCTYSLLFTCSRNLSVECFTGCTDLQRVSFAEIQKWD